MSHLSYIYSAKDLKELHSLTKDLAELNVRAYWRDLIFTALIAWGFLYLAFVSTNGGLVQILALLISALAFYRGANFVHDLSHSRGELESFKVAYNFLFGFFLRVPAYLGESHIDHHSIAKFGTKSDPEYEAWSHRHELNVFRPLLASFVSPFLLMFRMVFVTCWYLVRGLGMQKAVFLNLSSIVMNFSYIRSNPTDLQLDEMLESDVSSLFFSLASFSIWASYGFSLAGFLSYYSILVLSNGLFSFRALANHRYDSKFQKRGPGAQFFDSVSVVPGTSALSRWITALWAPLHSNYHSIHHLLPHMPYYAMPEIHKRLLDHPTWSKIYGQTTEESLFTGLRKLYGRARLNRLRSKLQPSENDQIITSWSEFAD